MQSIAPMNKEEAIFLAKFPDGSKPEGYRRAPIEREDWPAPPEPAAAYPELCKSLALVASSFNLKALLHRRSGFHLQSSDQEWRGWKHKMLQFIYALITHS